MENSTTETRELTYGEKAVGLTFNHGEGESFNMINHCKTHYATIIDDLNTLRLRTESSEQKRLCSIAITEAQSAQMWAVKAITWKD